MSRADVQVTGETEQTPVQRWLMNGTRVGEAVHAGEAHSWWRVMCLTGVDYFSTLGYQPGIAALAAGVLSPIATLVLVALTLFGALPVYSRVAAQSTNGEGSISMLEKLLSYWPSKLLVLALLGFMATDFIITITLSAADASAHLLENPWVAPLVSGHLTGWQITVTLTLVLLLGAVFLRGFTEATGIAVVLVAVYLALNLVVLGRGLGDLLAHPALWAQWGRAMTAAHGSPLAIVAVALLVFPKLALGLSGFETGVGLMPQIKGAASDTPQNPAGRIANTRKLLTGAALIMSVYLVLSSLVTTLLIPQSAFWPVTSTTHTVNAGDLAAGRASVNVGLDDAVSPQQSYTLTLPPRSRGTFTVPARLDDGEVLPLGVTVAGQNITVTKQAGAANGRALAYLAHQRLGNTFGTVYDVSTILILWFAGASAMAGLINVVPRFLPRYGMAPEWTRASRPLVLLYTAVAVIVTLLFRANVDAQGGAYATGVLVLMTSAAIAVTLSARKKRPGNRAWVGFAVISLVFIYTTVLNVIERPEGLAIASGFIGLILIISLLSRIKRSFELRVREVLLDDSAVTLLHDFPIRPLRLVAHHPGRATADEYHHTEILSRQMAHLPDDAPFLFLEIELTDASDFEDVVTVRGERVGPYSILKARGSSVPNTIAALMLHLRGRGAPPQVYMRWSNDSPVVQALRFIVEGRGDVPPLTHEILRRAERDADRRPIVHVGG
jgi:hypothetical protein